MMKLLWFFPVCFLFILTGCSQTAAEPTVTAAPITTPVPTAIPPTASPKATATLPAQTGTIAFGRALPFPQNDDIYLIQTDGTGLKQLTGNGGRTESPAWSPDGSKIAYHYVSFSNGEADWPAQVWVMNADGSGQTQLTRIPVGGSYPAWSADGKQIVFNSGFYPIGTYGPAQIYIINADGGEMRRVTNGPDNDLFPTFAPDGKILFLRKKFSYASDLGDVFAINPDGTGLVQITKVGYVGWYALSPDGTLLAIHNKNQNQIEILTMDGSQQPMTLVDKDFRYDFVQIAWSPDGKRLALARADLLNVYGFPVYIVNADGSGLTTIPHADDAISIAWRPR
jgi:TolB protein